MRTTKTRIILNTKDVMQVLDCSCSTALRLMARIKKYYNKAPYALVSVHEFCEFTGLRKEDVNKIISET